MNEFSLVSRILGSLFYRSPDDNVLQPLLTLIKDNKLKGEWPFEQDELIDRLQRSIQPEEMLADYRALFIGSECRVAPFRANYDAGDEQECRDFLQCIGMEISEGRADHFGLLLIAASWIEDNCTEPERSQQQIELFDNFLFPWCGKFLGKVETHAQSNFYRVLTMITREALQAMRDELVEDGI